MTNKEILKKRIIYRAAHRGTKEMDILLGKFVKKHITKLNIEDLKNLNQIIELDDEVLYQWYFDKSEVRKIFDNEISKKLKKFKP